jgi:pyruvate formate lyase activating enzyme
MSTSSPAAARLAQVLESRTAPGELSTSIPGKKNWVHCYACGHDCRIPPGHEGICKIRRNEGGTLLVPWGYVASVACDPMEKKPFFHVLPGRDALSFGMLGCDYHCSYCQNWITSQALRDPQAIAPAMDVEASRIADLAAERNAGAVVSTYNEPLITSEWAMEIFRLARERGLLTGYVSNGNATPGVLDYLRPHTDLYKVDLKSFRQARYRELGGVLRRVLETIEGLVARGFWVEVVTLVVPGFNDSEGELKEIARFLASVSPDIPWHVTAFHKDYRMTEPGSTPAATLLRSVETGREAGLRFVYAGNLPGLVGNAENTVCPACSALLVERSGHSILANHLNGSCCPACGTHIPGIWETPAGRAIP